MKEGVVEGLLDAIRAAPLDDPARRVLADYYESEGDGERAAFIRLQLDHARQAPYLAEAIRNRIEQRVFLHARGQEWRDELPQLEGVTWGRFARGLVDRVGFDSVQVFARHAAECHRAVPFSSATVRWPRLTDEPPALPSIEGLLELTVVGRLLKADDMRWLATSPSMSTVRALNLVDSQLQVPALRELLASPYLSELQVLRIPVHDLGNDGVALLVGAKLPHLVELDLSVASADDLGSGGRYQPTMDATGAAALAAWPGLARIRTLDLTGNQIGVAGLEAVLSSPHAAGLERLRIRGLADWDEDGDRADVLVAFSAANAGMALDELDISECGLTEASAAAMTASPALATLSVLAFNYTHTDPFPRLIRAPWWDSLRVLSANDCGETGMRALLGRWMPSLHALSLSSHYYWSRVDTVAELLAAGPVQQGLLELDLASSGITDEGLAALGTANASLPALLSLRIGSIDREAEGEVEFSFESADAFARSPLGSRLLSLACAFGEVDRAPEPGPLEVGSGEYRGPLRHL